jgi:ABC-type transport system involved in cytochrome c biogenesis permease subunit
MRGAPWLALLVFLICQPARGAASEAAVAQFREHALSIDTSVVDPMPVQNRGRVKPFHTHAREMILFLTGKYSLMGLSASQLFLGIITSEIAPELELINVRNASIRVPLDLPKDRKLFSLKEIEGSRLVSLIDPLLEKQRMNEKSLSQTDKDTLEVAQQMWLVRALISGDFFFSSINLNPSTDPQAPHSGNPELVKHAVAYLRALSSSKEEAREAARALVANVRSQPVPELFRPHMGKMEVEVLYNKLHLFLVTGILYFLLGVAFASGIFRERIKPALALGLVALPGALHLLGFTLRVYITGFAPVTNMYGTMIWMALGVVFFGSLLFHWYRQLFLFGILLAGAGVTLLLTESVPLMLSPDLDPIVAVLRSNFWLTIHVLTITISYAAFTIAMLIGNTAIVRTILKGEALPGSMIEEMGKVCYRSIQIGVLLLTAGIILGGWWADYSWGRFWGWDPKETWALIADLGFLALLHARYAGWANSYVMLALSPIAYLLVLMAWYGVNFILAAGLHSYGFSSGGAIAVLTFVTVQVIVIGLGLWTMRSKLNLLLRPPVAKP